jgi:hypothetical protein
MVYHAMVELLPIERVCTPGYLLAVVMPFKGGTREIPDVVVDPIVLMVTTARHLVSLIQSRPPD